MNAKLILYALHCIKQRKVKNFVISFSMILIVFTLFSLLLVQSSLKNILQTNIDGMPEITLQKLQGGRIVHLKEEVADGIIDIAGITSVTPRVWGYYFYEPAEVNLILASYDLYGLAAHKSFEPIIQKIYEKKESKGLIIGRGVEKMLKKYRGDTKSMTFVNNQLKTFTIPVSESFKSENSIFSNDIILMPKDQAYKILEIPQGYVTDIAVNVKNNQEINTIVKKIKKRYPSLRIITKEGLKSGYEQVLSYKSGLFIMLFIIILISFFLLVFEKASGLSEFEKKEIAILKAIGWQSKDILWVKSIENIIIVTNAFLIGYALSLIFVFILNAPYLREIYLGFNAFNPSFKLIYHFDFSTLCITFLLSVGIYLAAVLFPTYKCAIIDADEGLR